MALYQDRVENETGGNFGRPVADAPALKAQQNGLVNGGRRRAAAVRHCHRRRRPPRICSVAP